MPSDIERGKKTSGRVYDENEEESEDEKKRDLPRNVTSMSLEEALEQAIKDENYELAAKIRDRINSRNQNQ